MGRKPKENSKTNADRNADWRFRANQHREAVILYASMFLVCRDLIPQPVRDLLQKHWTPEIREAVNYLDDPKLKGQTSTRATIPKFQEVM